MKIQEQDEYHGPVLMQIVEHPTFTALNKADHNYGHYLVNADRRLLVKYATRPNAPSGKWKFTFTPADLSLLDRDRGLGKVFVALVCGRETICPLTADEIQQVLDLGGNRKQQWVSVETPSGKSIRCSGANGPLKLKIPHNRFPNCIF